MNQKLTVGIADMKIGKGNDLLVTYALGSCIGLCFYDPRPKLGALLHIMLPLNMEAGRKNPLKYADIWATSGSATLRASTLFCGWRASGWWGSMWAATWPVPCCSM